MNSQNVCSLLASASQGGVLTSAASSILSGSLDAVVVAGASGMDLEDIQASEVTLVTLLVDASSSIHSSGLEDSIREGQRMFVDALASSREKDSVLSALWTFNDEVRVVHSYVPIGDSTKLDKTNYQGLGSTKLYDTWCDALAANVAYAERLRASGTPTRSVVVVITDGEDCGSRRRASDCAAVSKALLASEQFVLAFVGVGTGGDFRRVARSMGIPDGSIAVQSSTTPSELRGLFRMMSQSAIRASRTHVAAGAQGFFAP